MRRERLCAICFRKVSGVQVCKRCAQKERCRHGKLRNLEGCVACENEEAMEYDARRGK